MRWVWVGILLWAVLSVPVGLLVGRWLRSLWNEESGTAATGRTPVSRRRGGPASLGAVLAGVHAGRRRGQAAGPAPDPATNPRLAPLSHRPRRSGPGSGPQSGGGTIDR